MSAMTGTVDATPTTEAIASGATWPAQAPVSDTGPPAARANSVFADVHWVGLCDNRRALERAMRERGAHLQDLPAGMPNSDRDRFLVVVDVHASKGTHRYAARVAIQSESGARDVREVEAERCDELHSVIAWVLVVLARGPRALDEDTRARDATPESANHLPAWGPAPAAFADSGAKARVPAPSVPAPGYAPSNVRLVYGRVVPKVPPRFALGAQLMSGWFFVSEPAWGAAGFVEYRPVRASPRALRLTLLQLANNTVDSGSGIGVAIKRTAARLGASVKVTGVPLSFVGGVEAGWLSAHGSGAVVSHGGRSAWGAGFAGMVMDFALLRDRLWFEACADVSVSPFSYAFHTTSARTIRESGPVELRAAAGLKSSF